MRHTVRAPEAGFKMHTQEQKTELEKLLPLSKGFGLRSWEHGAGVTADSTGGRSWLETPRPASF